MPLQTYDQYFGQAQSPAEGFRKGLLTGEGIKNRQFQNALSADANARAGQQNDRAEAQNKRQQERWDQEKKDKLTEVLGKYLSGVDDSSNEAFLKTFMAAKEPLGRSIVDVFGDTSEAADIIMSMKNMQNLMLPDGRMDAPVQQEVERARNYIGVLKKSLGVEKKQTPEEKAKQELETYEGKKKIDQKYPDPEKPGEAEERKIRLEKAKVDLQNAKTAYQKSLKGDKLTDDDVIYFGERLAKLQKKRDDAGPPSTFMGIKYGGGEDLTEGEKQEMVVLDRLLHQEYPASKLDTGSCTTSSTTRRDRPAPRDS